MRHLTFRLLLTERCNIACSFCHNEGQSRLTRQMSLPPDRVASLIGEALRFVPTVTAKLSGGEPTLHPHFVDYAVSAREAGAAELVVISNGTRLAPLLQLLRRVSDARFSVNIPTADEAQYRCLTGGDLALVVENVRRLRAAGAEVRLNTYWPASRSDAELVAMVELSAAADASLKVLAPCEMPRGHEHSNRWGSVLENQGFTKHSSHGHIDRYQRSGMVVRVQRPWCPEHCREMTDEEATVRIRASGELVTCLTAGAPVLGAVGGDSRANAALVAKAIEAAGSVCDAVAVEPGALLVRRHRARSERVRPGV